MLKPTPKLITLRKLFIIRAKRLATMLAANGIPDKETRWQIQKVEDALIRIRTELVESGLIEVQYWRGKDTWPFSIDEDPKSREGTLETIKVSPEEIHTDKKTGKKYYDLTCGMGTSVRLLVKKEDKSHADQHT